MANAPASATRWVCRARRRAARRGESELTHRGSSAEVLARGTPAWRPRGVRVLVSDLLWIGEPLLALRPFTEGASSAVVIQLLAESDANPPEEGALRLIDAET